MTSGEAVAAAVERIGRRDAILGRHAEWAVGWMTAGEGVKVLHQAGVQHFMWYDSDRTAEIPAACRNDSQLGWRAYRLASGFWRRTSRHETLRWGGIMGQYEASPREHRGAGVASGHCGRRIRPRPGRWK